MHFLEYTYVVNQSLLSHYFGLFECCSSRYASWKIGKAYSIVRVLFFMNECYVVHDFSTIHSFSMTRLSAYYTCYIHYIQVAAINGRFYRINQVCLNKKARFLYLARAARLALRVKAYAFIFLAALRSELLDGSSSSQPLQIKKAAKRRLFHFGRGEIRTPGWLPNFCFQDRRNRPLCHSS